MNLRLDSNNDIIVGRGLERVTGVQYVSQLIGNRLKTLLGEWKLNPSIGLPWFTDLLKHTPNMDLIYTWIYKTIKETNGVQNVSELILAVDKVDRRLLVTFTATSIYGEFTSREVL